MRRRIERSEIKIIASPTAFRRFGCCGNVRSAITSTPAKIEATESTRKFDAVTASYVLHVDGAAFDFLDRESPR